jgi:RNA polymerase sigma factor for flagellar operon FliA
MFDAALVTREISRESQHLTRDWVSKSRRVPVTPGGIDPGFIRARSREERVDATCRRMQRLLREVAYRLARRLPSHVEVDELIGAGAVGLVTAVRQHLDKPAVELERLASRRIRGAIMDHLRAADHLTRRQRAAVAAMQRAKAALERDGDDSGIDSVAKRLGLSTRRATQIHDRLMAVQIGSLDGIEAVGTSTDTIDTIIEREDHDRLNAAVATLPKRLRTLVTLCYFDELSYRDVSETLGISRSRVCQLHAQAMRALRKSLAR